jgi:hypothetical protein
MSRRPAAPKGGSHRSPQDGGRPGRARPAAPGTPAPPHAAGPEIVR